MPTPPIPPTRSPRDASSTASVRRRWLALTTAAVLAVSLMSGGTAAIAAGSTPDPTPTQAPTPAPVAPAPEPTPAPVTPAPTPAPVTPEPEPEPVAPKPTAPADNPKADERATLDAAGTVRVVALGDSYASGEGAYTYDVGTNMPFINKCHRSPYSWQRNVTLPGIGSVADPSKVDLIHVACSGAVTTNITNSGQWDEPKQLNALNGTEKVVLLSIGGNNLHFGDTVKKCIIGTSDCLPPAEVTVIEQNIKTLVGVVDATMLEIWKRAPQAQIVLVGYPRLMEQAKGTFGCVGITDRESATVDALGMSLRRAMAGMVMAQASGGRKVVFVDTADKFKGHGACTSDEWINPFLESPSWPVELMHPSKVGYSAYTQAVNEQLAAPRRVCLSNRVCFHRFADETVVKDMSAALTPTLTVIGAINKKYIQVGGASGWLGAPTGNEACGLTGGGCVQYFKGGAIYWSSASGAWTVRDKMLAKFKSLNWEKGVLGYPISDQRCGLKDGGCVQSFQRGAIYSSPTGVWAVRDKMLAKFKSMGWENGLFGYPIEDQFSTEGGTGIAQRFQGAIVLWKNGTPTAFYANGAIRKTYSDSGYTDGPLGFPTGDPFTVATGDGRAQRFDGGITIWKAGSGKAFYLNGAIFKAFAASGYTDGPLGFPTSNPFTVNTGNGRAQFFQKGVILWKKGAGQAYYVAGTIRTAYSDAKYTDGVMKFPTSNAYWNKDQSGKIQNFEGGKIYWKKDAAKSYYVVNKLVSLYPTTWNPDMDPLGYDRYAGWPTAHGNCGLWRGGCKVKFTLSGGLGYVTWHPDYGSHLLWDEFAILYRNWGEEDGKVGDKTIGYPIEAEHDFYRNGEWAFAAQRFSGNLRAERRDPEGNAPACWALEGGMCVR